MVWRSFDCPWGSCSAPAPCPVPYFSAEANLCSSHPHTKVGLGVVGAILLPTLWTSDKEDEELVDSAPPRCCHFGPSLYPVTTYQQLPFMATSALSDHVSMVVIWGHPSMHCHTPEDTNFSGLNWSRIRVGLWGSA